MESSYNNSFNYPNKRILEQVIWRVNFNDNQGSSIVYSLNNNFYKTREFKTVYFNLINLYNKFLEHIISNWPWLYDSKKLFIK